VNEDWSITLPSPACALPPWIATSICGVLPTRWPASTSHAAASS